MPNVHQQPFFFSNTFYKPCLLTQFNNCLDINLFLNSECQCSLNIPPRQTTLNRYCGLDCNQTLNKVEIFQTHFDQTIINYRLFWHSEVNLYDKIRKCFKFRAKSCLDFVTTLRIVQTVSIFNNGKTNIKNSIGNNAWGAIKIIICKFNCGIINVEVSKQHLPVESFEQSIYRW